MDWRVKNAQIENLILIVLGRIEIAHGRLYPPQQLILIVLGRIEIT